MVRVHFVFQIAHIPWHGPSLHDPGDGKGGGEKEKEREGDTCVWVCTHHPQIQWLQGMCDQCVSCPHAYATHFPPPPEPQCAPLLLYNFTPTFPF